jgi:hypothetical protein
MKVSLVFILLISHLHFVLVTLVQRTDTDYSFFPGPAHILCLTVASGWNKERCLPVVGTKITVTEKYPIFLYFLPVASIQIYSV